MPIEGFTFDPVTKKIKYPGDPPHVALAETKLGNETIIFYDYAWTLILQQDGSFEVARLD